MPLPPTPLTDRTAIPHPHATGKTLAWCAVVGAGLATCFQDGTQGIRVALFVALAASAVVMNRAPRHSQQWTILGLALLCAGVFAIRSSWWTLSPFLFTFAVLLVGYLLADSRSLFNLSWSYLQRWVWHFGARVAPTTPDWFLRGAKRALPGAAAKQSRTGLKALAVTMPVLAVLGALLAAADPLFATFLEPDLRLTSAVTWMCLFVVGVASAAFVVRIAHSDPTAVSQAGQPLSLGTIESLCLLSGVTVLFLAYVAVQGMAALGLGEQSLAAQGLSVAEYARSGYFQLLAVVFLTSMVLITVDGTRGGRSHTRPSERILFAVIVLLTLVIEIVALRRLLLYVDSFGLTMLRLACLAAAVWMAALLVLICASVLGAKSRKRWLPAGITMAFIVTSFAFAVLNPEALVVSYNVHHPHDTPIDLDYVASLSDDAVPALVDALDELGPAEAAYLQAQLCERSAQSPGVLGWSLSRQQGANALAIACPPGSNSMVASK